jgi:3-dehydroquinate synthase
LEKITVNTPGSVSEIFIGENWETVGRLLPQSGVVIITDQNVHALYGKKFPDYPVLIVQPGEQSKRLEVVGKLAEKLMEGGIDRSGFLLGIGGGVVCDITGFLASVYMRGIRFGYVSTTLLAQVDASTGGKNGVNLGDSKNILGCFRQPEFVVCDPVMLYTLTDEEYFSGLAELIKTGIIGNAKLFEKIEHNREPIIRRDSELLSLLISMAVNFKASVVSEDEKESGIRRILNFGHTFGHAIELNSSMAHGFAVASGMELAARYSCNKGLISVAECERIINILKSFDLLRTYYMPDDQVGRLILHDKKKAGSNIYFVFTEGIGKALVEKVPVREVVDFYLNNKPEK